MSSETLQKIAAPLVVAAVLGAASVALKVARLEAQVAALESRMEYQFGKDTR